MNELQGQIWAFSSYNVKYGLFQHSKVCNSIIQCITNKKESDLVLICIPPRFNACPGYLQV